jgi:hypothetical protein
VKLRTSRLRSIDTSTGALALGDSAGLDDMPTRYTRSASYVNG